MNRAKRIKKELKQYIDEMPIERLAVFLAVKCYTKVVTGVANKIY